MNKFNYVENDYNNQVVGSHGGTLFNKSQHIRNLKEYREIIEQFPDLDSKTLDVDMVVTTPYRDGGDFIKDLHSYEYKEALTDRLYHIDSKIDPTTMNRYDTINSFIRKLRIYLDGNKLVYSNLVAVNVKDEGNIEWNLSRKYDWNELRDSLTETLFNYIMECGIGSKVLVDTEYKIAVKLDTKQGYYHIGTVDNCTLNDYEYDGFVFL